MQHGTGEEATSMSWTDERVELLKKHWADGLSASQIATELGGVTRNAVIGKVHRLGLAARAKSTRSTSTQRPRKARTAPRETTAKPRFSGNAALKVEAVSQADAAPEPVQLRVVQEELYIPPEERASILTLSETRCRWPVGDPTHEDFYFCGRSCDAADPYCEHHAGVAFQPNSDRRRRANA
jgi:GcrA cell cycle regulator